MSRSPLYVTVRFLLPKVFHDWKLRSGGVGFLRSRITRVDVQSLVLGHGRSLGLKVHGPPQHVLI